MLYLFRCFHPPQNIYFLKATILPLPAWGKRNWQASNRVLLILNMANDQPPLPPLLAQISIHYFTPPVSFSIINDLARSCFNFWHKIGDESDKTSSKKTGETLSPSEPILRAKIKPWSRQIMFYVINPDILGKFENFVQFWTVLENVGKFWIFFGKFRIIIS